MVTTIDRPPAQAFAWAAKPERRFMPDRRTILWSLFAVQALCCAYFLLDTGLDFFRPTAINPLADSDTVEGLITIALFFGLAFTASELRRLLNRQSEMTDQLKVASGAFTELLETRFGEWRLSPAERDIAILSLKGFSVAEMAELRNSAQGTVKAQCAALYRKAGVSGRLQLLSVFLEDLLADSLIEAATSPAQN